MKERTLEMLCWRLLELESRGKYGLRRTYKNRFEKNSPIDKNWEELLARGLAEIFP